MTRLPKKSLRILIKAVLLFAIFNYAFSLVPDSALWRVSLYNTVLPGKTRFTLENNLDVLFNVHEIANSARENNAYKVVLLGDSSTWGYLLNPGETSASIINASRTSTCKGQTVHVYNLGYPVPSVLKDALLLQRALSYKPNLIIWDVTLLSVFETQALVDSNIFLQNNANAARNFINKYKLATRVRAPGRPTLQSQTFLARRDGIARFIRDQLDGIRWQATGGERVNKAYTPHGMDVEATSLFEKRDLPPPTLDPARLRFDTLNAGIRMAGNTPIVIVNEPIQVVNGKNSAIRYNTMYPRWVYDQYRDLMTMKSAQYHWNYIDLWNTIPPTLFSDSPLHRTPPGEKMVSSTVKEIILKNACP